METVLLTVAYDGSRYYGWQRQTKLRSVQGELEKALSHALKQPITVDASGRTDAGVHGLAQTVTFRYIKTLPIEKMVVVINRRLPEDIIILSAEKVNDDFHARYCAIAKAYEYHFAFGCDRNPFNSSYRYNQPHHLDIDKMIVAMKDFEGTHDFTAFQATGSEKENTIRTIYKVHLEKRNDEFVFTVVGNGFLYNMVRIMMGTLFSIGNGQIPEASIPQIIKSQLRANAKVTAPANGLYLKQVFYDKASLENFIKNLN
ncbi:MAG: tRNA pseudouridine(38-40) synthase TruA [Clostridiales bacterium 38-18]|nr:MAG: tRNA pseudouridine(38-40) synthase TruA [Clostridiales bacterium 38-18]